MPVVGVRVLVFSADIGEGHDLPARVLRDAILARRPDAEVVILDSLTTAGPVARALVRSGSELILGRLRGLFDVQYWLAARFPPTRALAARLTARLGRALVPAVADHGADVVVSTYPVATEALAAARARGRLAVPVVSAITDLAALRYWAHRGCDLHLVIHPESAAEIRAIAGPAARIAPVRGLTTAAFETPADGASARVALGLPAGAPVVAVSGGGWAVGDLGGAVGAALEAAPGVHVLALCGRNAAVRRRLEARFAGRPEVRVLGFTDRMADVLAAADVLVHSTAGLTVLEALVRGTRVISYGWGVGHLRLNNRAYVRFGLADVVGDRRALAPAIRRGLAVPRRPDPGYGGLPAAADLVLELADRANPSPRAAAVDSQAGGP
jgi:UDP-N-acetylglucosamine:LPS N-acetylglucosamine transferase